MWAKAFGGGQRYARQRGVVQGQAPVRRRRIVHMSTAFGPGAALRLRKGDGGARRGLSQARLRIESNSAWRAALSS